MVSTQAHLRLFSEELCAFQPVFAVFGCGTPAVQPDTGRVVSGEDARPHSWPWQVAETRSPRSVQGSRFFPDRRRLFSDLPAGETRQPLPSHLRRDPGRTSLGADRRTLHLVTHHQMRDLSA